MVNAPLITLRSPIDGTLKFLGPTACGAKTGANEPLLAVENNLAGEDALDNLKDERALLEARTASFRRELRALSVLREDLSASARKYQEARLRTLELDCKGAKAGLESARAAEKHATRRRNRLSGCKAVPT